MSFTEGILTLQFTENAFVDVDDVIYIFCYALQESKGKPFGLLFDSSTKHELSEEAIVYFAKSNYIHNISAIAYISKDLISKIRLSLFLIFEKPPVKPKIFANETKAMQWLEKEISLVNVTC